MSPPPSSIDDPVAGTADPWGAARSQDGAAPPLAEGARCYLMVFEASSATMVPLPPSGELLIGRGNEAHLRVRAPAASRLHVRLVVQDGAVQIADLSRHGTLLNGAPLCGAAWLSSGDVVSICDTRLVFHRDARAPRGAPLCEPGQLRQRLAEEIERARRYRRALAVLCASAGGVALARPALAAALCDPALPFVAAAAFAGEAHLLLLLPEAGEGAAARVLACLRQAAPGLRLGLASCPEDGCDPDAIIAGARAAADGAPDGADDGAGAVVPASRMAARLQVGGRTVVIAEPVMAAVYDLLRKLARSDMAVLITGETGSGKEIAATALHDWSPRQQGRLVAINCAALPESLAEGLLFGHERGAFSGAVSARQGLLESAHGGTVFLDEVGELALPVQAKLLRALETGRVLHLGDVHERPIDVRIVAATHRDLEAEVRAGRFREDLYFRLCAATVALPPLRDRRRELPLLARAFLGEALGRLGRPPLEFSVEALHALLGYPWPGNLRELRNAIDFAATVAEGRIELQHLPPRVRQAAPGPADKVAAPRFRPIDEELRDIERARMLEALEAAGWVQSRAAELIAMPRRTFVTKSKLYGLTARRGPATPDEPGT